MGQYIAAIYSSYFYHWVAESSDIRPLLNRAVGRSDNPKGVGGGAGCNLVGMTLLIEIGLMCLPKYEGAIAIRAPRFQRLWTYLGLTYLYTLLLVLKSSPLS